MGHDTEDGSINPVIERLRAKVTYAEWSARDGSSRLSMPQVTVDEPDLVYVLNALEHLMRLTNAEISEYTSPDRSTDLPTTNIEEQYADH